MLILSTPLYAQINGDKMTLEEAIRIAHTYSPQAQIADLNFMSQYWSFRSYKAQFLPSLNLGATVGNYNRSLVEVRDPVTGEISYVANNSLSNNLNLSIDQNIALTGGRISLNTDLARLDQFDSNNKILYSSNPVTINYSQPIRGFNTLKWQKKTAPRQYEVAKRNYLNSKENITINATQYFFAVLSAQSSYDKVVNNNSDTKKLYEIAKKRFDIGTITKSELLQLELSLLNSDLAINNSRVSLDIALFNFRSYLGISERDNLNINFIAPMIAPNIVLEYDMVLDRAYSNSSHKIDQEIKIINAEQGVAEAKSAKGLQADLSANIGFSQSSDNFKGSYTSLKDREVVGLTLRMPIYDWGLSRGKVKMAEAQERLAITEAKQEEMKFVQDIRIKVIQFNNQATQCEISIKARLIADERYEITKKRFENGSITVTDLNTAQEEKDGAQEQYINQLSTFWNAYYEIQRMSLYDYINNKDISVEFDKIIEK